MYLSSSKVGPTSFGDARASSGWVGAVSFKIEASAMVEVDLVLPTLCEEQAAEVIRNSTIKYVIYLFTLFFSLIVQ